MSLLKSCGLALCLQLALPAQADTRSLYLGVLGRLEPVVAPAASQEAELARLHRVLEPLLGAYAEGYPQAPRPRLRLLVDERLPGMAGSLDSGLVMVNPLVSMQMSEPALAGLLAHELAHIGLEHGWARARLAYDSVSGTRELRLARAVTGRHPLKGSPAWTRLLHEQEYEADRAGRALLERAGLPGDWIAAAIPATARALVTDSHPSGQQRLQALTASN